MTTISAADSESPARNPCQLFSVFLEQFACGSVFVQCVEWLKVLACLEIYKQFFDPIQSAYKFSENFKVINGAYFFCELGFSLRI